MRFGSAVERLRAARFSQGDRATLACRLLCLWTLLGMLAAGYPPAPAEGGKINLTLSGVVIFPDASPDLVPVLGPQNVTMRVKVKGRRGIPWVLTFIALSDFQSGSDVIPINTVSWAVSPNPPYQDGTLSTVSPVVVASGVSHSDDNATFSFTMPNSWDYAPGNYVATATFTLISP